MKGFFACLLAMFMITAMTALGETVVEDSVAHSFECQGFESSEAAMAAYLEAMKAGDVQGMLATFAIETWVDAGDPQVFLESRWTFIPNNVDGMGLPAGNPYVRAIAVNGRYSSLVNALYRQYLLYSWPEAYGAYTGEPLKLEGESDVESFLSALSASTFSTSLTGMEIADFVDPATLSDMYLSETNQKTIARQTSGYGCAEVQDVVVRLKLDGEEWYQCMWVGRYGEKWYNLKLGGNIGVLLGVDSYAGGLFPASSLHDE